MGDSLKEAQEGKKELYIKEFHITKRSHVLYMLPHSTIWEATHIAIIIVHVYLACLTFTYSKTFKKDMHYFMMEYTFEAMYFLYILFTVLHRNVSIHKKDYCTVQMPFLHLVIGIITLIPFYEIYEFLVLRETYDLMTNALGLRVTLRLCHVILYFSRKRIECSGNRILMVLIETFAINSIYVCIFSCLVGWLGCYGCEFSNWTTHQKDNLYDHTNFRQRLIYPMVFIGSLLMGNYSGMLIPENIPEIVTVLLTMVVGSTIKTNFMLAQFISEYVTSYWRHTLYKMRLRNIDAFIEFEELSKGIKSDILEYYDVLWNKRFGIVHWNMAYFGLLPDSLKREIKLDLSWDALSHSHFFRDSSLPLKNAVGNLMNNHFMLKGDVIYDTGDLKHTLIYVASGIVQLLSDEDDESPIMSFASGTVISECACLMLGQSEAKLQCASYCELRILRLVDFYRGMTFYKSNVLDYQDLLRERIKFAKKMQAMKLVKNKTKVRPICRVKLQWKNILHGKVEDSDYHTSKYMDLIALGDELDLKVEVICLTSKFPLIMDPDSSFRQFTEIIVLTACIIESAIIPYCAAFAREISSSMRTFLILLDFIYVLDIYLQITTAVVENNIMIVKLSTILLHRIKQISFLVDMLAIIPLDYIYWAHGCTPRAFIMWKLPRILKIYKLIILVRKFENSMVNVNGLFILFLKYNLLWFLCVYFFTCLLYVTSCYTEECTPFSWYQYNLELTSLTDSDIKPVMNSLLCVVDVFSSGKQNFYFYNFTDSLVALIMIIVCYYLIPTATGEIAANQFWKYQQVAMHKSFISSVMAYVHIHRLKRSLVVPVQNILKHRRAHPRGLFLSSASEFLRELPEKLEERVREEMIGPWLDNLTLFQTLDEPVRRRIMHMAELISFPESAQIIRANETPWHLYIIKRGVCQVTSMIPGDFERKTDEWLYSSGDCFPVMESMHEIPSFLNVVALTAVDAILIPYDKMIKTMKYDTLYYKSMCEALELHLYAHTQTLLRLQARLQPVYTKRVRTVEYFKYVIDDNIEVEVKKPNFFNRTINPFSKLYITYEVIHCILVVFQFVILILKMNLLYQYRYVIDMLSIICDIRCWVDILIRLRLHYYRSDGILITDYKSVKNYYMRHSFAVDLYASCPFSMLAMDSTIYHFKPVVARHFLSLISRPVQLYRVFMGIHYLCNSIKILTEATISRIQCFLLIMVTIPLGGNFLLLSVCTLDYEVYMCPMTGWRGGDIVNITTITSLVHYSYLTSLYLHGSPKNQYGDSTNFTYAIYIFFSVISVSLTWFTLSKLISLGLHGQFLTLQVQNDRRNFSVFAKVEGIATLITEKVLQLNSYLNRDILSNALTEAEKRMTPQLLTDVSFALNEGCLVNNALFFDAVKHIQKNMICRFNRLYYMKDDIIIRNNDINEYIFIVKKGHVDISIANYHLTVLGCGGMFGCISNQKRIRQTIDAVATMHTEILCIKTCDFNRYIFQYEKVMHRMHNYIAQSVEYAEAHYHLTGEEDRSTVTAISSHNPYIRLFENIQKAYSSHYKTYIIFYHITHMHVAAFSTMFTLVYQLIAMQNDITVELYVILYTLDVVFWCNLLLGFVLPYVDESSGLMISDPFVIARRYIKTKLFLDLFVVLPLELMFGLLTPTRFTTALLTSNRLLRIIFFFRHYNTYRIEAKLTHLMRWIYIAYVTCIYIQFFTNVWHFVACNMHKCRYRRFVSHEPEEYIEMISETYGYLFSYTHVVNFFTGNGLKAIKPLNITEVFVTFVLVVSSIFMMASIGSGYALVQIIDNYNLSSYSNRLNEVKKHLSNLKLSPVITSRVVEYYELLWKNQHGEQWPSLIADTRRYLNEDIMVDLYSEMFIHHIIFRDTHKDFIRQLLPFVKRVVYYQSMIIVERNVVDGQMYFIQSGRVRVVEDMGGGIMRNVNTLHSDQGFGEEQGLTGVPHKYTYISESLVVMLTLHKEDWMFLLEFFPASHSDILLHLRMILDPSNLDNVITF